MQTSILFSSCVCYSPAVLSRAFTIPLSVLHGWMFNRLILVFTLQHFLHLGLYRKDTKVMMAACNHSHRCSVTNVVCCFKKTLFDVIPVIIRHTRTCEHAHARPHINARTRSRTIDARISQRQSSSVIFQSLDEVRVIYRTHWDIYIYRSLWDRCLLFFLSPPFRNHTSFRPLIQLTMYITMLSCWFRLL